MARKQLVFRVPADLHRTLNAYQLALTNHFGLTILPVSRLLSAILCWRASYTSARAFEEAHPPCEQEPALAIPRDSLSQAAAMTEATYKADTFLRSRGIKPSQALFDAIRRLPLNPERPELLAPFVELRQQGGPALGDMKVRIGARTARRIQVLAEAWQMQPAEVVHMLVCTHPCLRLPVHVTPPRMHEAMSAAVVAEPSPGAEPLEFVLTEAGHDDESEGAQP